MYKTTLCKNVIEIRQKLKFTGFLKDWYDSKLISILVNKDKEEKYATRVTSKFEKKKKILRIGISSSGLHQNDQVEFAY